MNSEKINPQQLISPKRLDVLCKYRYFFEMLQGYSLGRTRTFYRNHIEKRTQGVEPDDQAGAFIPKNNVDDYEITAAKLLESLQIKSFDKDFSIPYLANGQLLNGAHRLAASLALEQDIYATQMQSDNPPPFWDFKWFAEHGFELPEQLNLLYDYAKLQQGKTAVFVFWEPSETHWQDFAQAIEANMDIVGDVLLHMPSGIAMYELVQDIYRNFEPYGNQQSPVSRKGALLAQGNRRVHVILAAANPQKNANNFYDVVRHVKEQCRDLAHNTIHKNMFLTLHASDSDDETWHMAQTLLSANNLSHLFSRAVFPIRPEFLQQLYTLPELCQSKQVLLDNICVVGSGSLEVVGVRPAADIDITLKTKDRDIHTAKGNKSFGQNFDIASPHYHRTQAGAGVPDDFLIDHPDLHFMYRGIKFANINVVLEHKSVSDRDKDKADIALFNDYVARPVPEFVFGIGFEQAIEAEKLIRGI